MSASPSRAPLVSGLLLALGVTPALAAGGGAEILPALGLLGLTAAVLLGALVLLLRARARQMRARLLAALDAAGTPGAAEHTQRLRDTDPALATSLQSLCARLADGSDRLDTVLDSMIDAVFVTDAEGRIQRCNRSAAKLLGWSAADLTGRTIDSLVADQERRRFALARATEETREYALLTREGPPVPVALSGSRLLAQAGVASPGCIFVGHDITERRRAERRVHYLARHDALTGVANRLQFQHLLQQALARAARTPSTLALLYLDLDRFKDVNDLFGHAAGDRTLEILSERLTASAPPGAVVGRLAGDEFALFVEKLAEPEARALLAGVARALLDDLSRGFSLNDHEVYLTVSIGIALAGESADNPIDLIRQADTAMYHAKQSGGGTFAFYDPQMSAATVARLTLKSKLRRALELDEFVVHYQPKVDLVTGRTAGAEALLRWRLPGHGDIPPSTFIPLAEQTGLIQPIGEWVLRRVLADYRTWLGRVPDPGRISINLSLRQLQQASFLARFAGVFREYGVDPSRLELEITETTLMSNAPRTLAVLGELRDLGIRLSIDDFGTGYSSLSALQQLPVETLKIDQSFVRDAATDPEDATLVKTIIEMARSLGLEVVAEGIETEAQLAFLRARGCHYGQGLLFGAPIGADELLARLIDEARDDGATRPGHAR
jgi:diguanylate cyclase (GGDEF)-like protein/PAS domain S-box-containing protein